MQDRRRVWRKVLKQVGILAAAAVIFSTFDDRDVSADFAARIMFESCQQELEQEKELRHHAEDKLVEEREAHKKEMADREAFWMKTYEEKEQEQAGAWCWQNYKTCEDDLARMDHDCLFNMRMAKLVNNEGNMRQLKARLKAWGLSPDAWCNATPEEVEKIKNLTGLDGSTGVPIVKIKLTMPAPTQLTPAEEGKMED